MKSILVMVLVIICNNVHSQSWRNGDEKFDFTDRMTSSAKVNIKTVNNVDKVCEAESRKRGHGGFGMSVQACTFWHHGPLGSTCDIYLSKQTSMHEIGHEIRHCFAGSFH
jgi:hypothetical protein